MEGASPAAGHLVHDIHIKDGARVQFGDSGGLKINTKVVPLSDYTGIYAQISLSPVPTYVDRLSLRQQLEEHLHNRITISHQKKPTIAVCGIGGAGKTQLVLDYIQRYRQDYSAIFWVDATSPETIERDYVQIYMLLYGYLHETEQSAVQIRHAVPAVKRWFHGSNKSNKRWLFVFDNADSVSNCNDPSYIDLRQFLPDNPTVHIIVTSRDRSVTEISELPAVEVDQMSEAEAVTLFRRQANLYAGPSQQNQQIDTIVRELGYLALAITLAGSYVAATPRLRTDLACYLSEYQERRETLLTQRPSWLVHQYGESVLTTWETTFRAIEGQSPEACALLALLSLFKQNDIPTELPTTSIDGEPLAWISSLFPRKQMNENDLKDLFRILAGFSLIRYQENRGGYSMNGLVQAWAYDRLEYSQQQNYDYIVALLLQTTTDAEKNASPMRRGSSDPHGASPAETRRTGETTDVYTVLQVLHTSSQTSNATSDMDLLRALFYKDMHARRLQLLPQRFLPATFDWIWSTQFKNWLSDPDSRIFWISGDPGSGKSTLMSYMSMSREFARIIEAVSGSPCIALSFFFDSGAISELANSLEGLYRALIYQAIQSRAFQSWERRFSLVHEPSIDVRTLQDDVCDLLKSTESTVCIFLDGLDEYAGASGELIRIIKDLAGLKNVKICLSSRREQALKLALADVPKAFVQKHYWKGIEEFSLATTGDMTDIQLLDLQDQEQKESVTTSSDSGIGSSLMQPTELVENKDSLPGDSGLGSSVASPNDTSHPLALQVTMQVALPSGRPSLHPEDIERLEPSGKDIGSRKGSSGSAVMKAAEAQLFACLSQNLQFMTGVTGLRLSLTAPDAQFELIEHLKFFFEDLDESAESRLDHACANLLRSHWIRGRIARLLIEDGNDDNSEDDDNHEQREVFSKSRRDLNNWLDMNLAFTRQHANSLMPPIEDESEDMLEILALEDVKSHEDIDEESAEIFQGVPDYIGQMEAFLLNGEPFRRLLQKLYSQNIRVKHLWLRDLLWTIPDDRIDINLWDPASFGDRIKHLLERVTGVQWEWWPLWPPRIPLYDGSCRITWNCYCGLVHCEDVQRGDAQRLHQLLEVRSTFNPSAHPCFINKTQRRPFWREIQPLRYTSYFLLIIGLGSVTVNMKPLDLFMGEYAVATICGIILTVYVISLCKRNGTPMLSVRRANAAGKFSDQGRDIEQKIPKRSGMSVPPTPVTEKINSSLAQRKHPNRQGQHTTPTQPNSNPGTSGAANGGSGTYSNAAVSSASAGNAVTTTGTTSRRTSTGGSGSSIAAGTLSGGASTNQLTPVLNLVLGTKQSLSHDIDFINFKDPTLQTDDDFLQKLRQIRSGRWTVFSWLSIFQLHSITFLQFVKEDEHYIGEGDTTRSFPTNNPDYSYRGNEHCPPVTNLPPVPEHYFTCFLNRCSSQCTKTLLIPWHKCTKASQRKSPNASQIPDIIDRVPKKRSVWDHKAPGRELVWGLRWKHKPSWQRAVIYSLLVLFGPMVFMICWEQRWPKDVQSATVPLMAGLGVLQIVWGSAWLADSFKGGI